MEDTILLVDDEEDICEVLDLSLSDLGYRVYTANNGEDAVRIFKDVNPSIILTDIRMPGMDGLELLRTIKKENPDTEVIMITGHGDIELAIKSLKYEATDFIQKPINDDVLEFALKRALERISMRRKMREYTENLEKLVGEILGLSHTLKTIASGFEGGSYVLEKGIELDHKDFVHQGWGMIKVSVDRIKNLSLGLLDYAKQTKPDYRLSDPNKPLKDIYALLKPRADQCGIRMTLELAPDPKAFYFDPDGIHRCLLNLVSNALDAVIETDTGEKDKEVVLKTAQIDEWGVEYQVFDNGSGIEEGVRDNIFKKVFSTKGPSGTGLGLVVAKRVIDDHHGVIGFETKKGVGTNFFVRLPERAQK